MKTKLFILICISMAGLSLLAGCGKPDTNIKIPHAEFYYIEKVSSTSKHLPLIKEWCSKNDYKLIFVLFDSSDGMWKTEDKKLAKIPALILYDITGNEVQRLEGPRAIKTFVSKRNESGGEQ